MATLDEIFSNSVKENKTKKSPEKKFDIYELEKTIRELAKKNGMQPRNFLIQAAETNPKLAQNRVIQKLIGEQDVPQQKGRDAKPEVLTKRAMNVVKKQIKKDANKERRRMDKDAVEEDGKDDFSKLANPMGGDSVKLAKIKKSPGFYDMIVTFFSSAVQDDRDDEEVLPIMSSMFNMNVEEIKAVLRQYGGHTFGGQSPEDKFKTNMKALGILGKAKSKTLNSVYEDADDLQSAYDKVYAYTDKLGDRALEKIDRYAPNFSQAMDQYGEIEDIVANSDEKELQTYMKELELVRYSLELDAGGINEDEKIKGSLGVQQIVNLFPKVDDKTQFMQAVMKLKLGQPVTALPQIRSLAQAFKQMIGMDPQETQKTMIMLKRLSAQPVEEGDLNAWYAEQHARELAEKDGKVWDRMPYGDKEDYRKIANKKYGVVKSEAVSDKTVDNFHTELDRLVHKYFGHSSDEKKEKVKEDDDKGEVMVGSYQTKHFDMCPSATQLYKDIDVKDMDLAERSAKLHDTLFYMEKHAQEMKEADPEYIEMMQNLADQIMAMAGMMGLESEHSYVQGHVDAVKDLGESVESITEEEFDEAAGEKDACYHKVKSRYKVWPSAYASGALVKCRKVGASNWGNKSK